MDLSQVSRTAILLLICRAVESEKNGTEFPDPMAVLCLERLLSFASPEERQWMLRHKRTYAGIQERDARAGVRRSQAFDRIADHFILAHPGCTLVNLACGFDTRFWRIKSQSCTYVELDLPEVMRLKKEILKEELGYEVIGSSVLDTSWIDTVTAKGNADFLLVAEGLFMWFPKQEVIRLFTEFGARFTRSQLVLDMVPEGWTKGIMGSLLRLHNRVDMGLDVIWLSGIRDAHELEAYGKGLKLITQEKGSAGPILTVAIN
jgi:O-methyltransferase involved in polyketide biosynthesis